MRVGEIWINKKNHREVMIDAVKYQKVVILEVDIENMNTEETDTIQPFNEDIVYSHWTDTGEELFYLRPDFINDFNRK